jgi:hypothetical protein
VLTSLVKFGEVIVVAIKRTDRQVKCGEGNEMKGRKPYAAAGGGGIDVVFLARKNSLFVVDKVGCRGEVQVAVYNVAVGYSTVFCISSTRLVGNFVCRRKPVGG